MRPARLHINLEELTVDEQLGLLNHIFNYAHDSLPHDKTLVLELETRGKQHD